MPNSPDPRPSKKRRIRITEPLVSSRRPNSNARRETARETFKPNTSHAKGKGKEPTVVEANIATGVPDNAVYPRTFNIVAGCYEKLLYGLEASFVQVDEPGSLSWGINLKATFIFPAHVACIKTVAASPSGGKWLATGSSDEIIKVWDLRRRKEIGGLVHHEGSITYLTFPSRSHLLSASEDGTLCLFRARDWAVLRTLKGHKGHVNCVGVHPSGKLALSVGKDRTLRMWDLMRGKGSASTKLGKEGEVVCWSPSGKRFAVQAFSSIELFSTNMALLYTITHPSRVHDVKFFRPIGVDGAPEFLLVAAEDKKVTVYELHDDVELAPKVVAELVGHTNRVKAISSLTVSVPPYLDNRNATIACTVSSDGYIRLYNLEGIVQALSAHATEQPIIIKPLTQYDTKGSRLTCVTMGDGEIVGGDNAIVGKKRRSDDVGDQASEVEDGASAEGKRSSADKEDDQEDSD